MAYIFASNNVAHWSGFAADTSVAAAYDSNRVPYALSILDNIEAALTGNHPPVAGTTTWYHFRLYTGGQSGASEDGDLLVIKDANGNFLCNINMSNGLLALGISGNGSTYTTGTYSGRLTVAVVDFDFEVDVTGSDVTVKFYHNQILHTSATISNTGSLGIARSLTFAPVDALLINQKLFMSEFLVADVDTRGARVSLLQPTTTGGYTDWDGVFAELSDDDASTGMTSDTATDRVSANLDTYAGGASIAAVLGVSRVARGASGPTRSRHFLRKSATNYNGIGKDLDLAPKFIVETWDLDPVDSAAWTSTKLSGYELGLQTLA